MLDSRHRSEDVVRVLVVVTVLAHRPEQLSLHPRSYYPEGVGNDVAGDSGDAGTDRVEFELVLMPTHVGLESFLDFLVQGKV